MSEGLFQGWDWFCLVVVGACCNQGSVCNTLLFQDIVLQVPSYNYFKGIGYSVSK